LPKFIDVGNDKYVVLGTVSVDSGYSTDELKNMWALADTVLRNGNKFYVCSKTIEAEFEEVK
tara:strand:- start:209 stop:394 length:186 start_codon:yes stop_codon:yes gene_type:complete